MDESQFEWAVYLNVDETQEYATAHNLETGFLVNLFETQQEAKEMASAEMLIPSVIGAQVKHISTISE